MAGKDRQSIDNVIEEILDYQVDGIITDKPKLLFETLQKS